jgi:hypothetical protein
LQREAKKMLKNTYYMGQSIWCTFGSKHLRAWEEEANIQIGTISEEV